MKRDTRAYEIDFAEMVLIIDPFQLKRIKIHETNLRLLFISEAAGRTLVERVNSEERREDARRADSSVVMMAMTVGKVE